MLRDVILMVPVMCVVGFAIYTTIQRLDRTSKAQNWRPAADIQIKLIEGTFSEPVSPSSRRAIAFTKSDGRRIFLSCYSSRGLYSPSNLNTCLSGVDFNSHMSSEKIFSIKYYSNKFDNGTDENVILEVLDGENLIFKQSLEESYRYR